MHEDEIPIGRAENLTGKQFDKLIVLYRVKNIGTHVAWKCQCQCGNLIEKRADVLRKQTQNACPNCIVGNNRIELAGRRFGHLTVIEEAGRNNEGGIKWKCQCDCGNITIVSSSNLIQGTTIGCGCQKGKSNILDITNHKFGKLIAKYPTKQRSGESVMWYCECECGGSKIVSSSHLIQGRTKSCGCIRSAGEKAIVQLLTQNNISFETEKSFDNCNFKKPVRFDFYIKNNYLIEYDGEQHYRGWYGQEESLTIIQQRDAYKNQWCKENNIPLIRIPYTKLDTLCIEDLMLEKTEFRVV